VKLRMKLDSRATGYLFGSRARGEANFMSDFDVFCVADHEMDQASLRRWASDYSVDLFLLGLESLSQHISDMDTVVLDALTEGRLLFDDLGMDKQFRERASAFVEDRTLVRTDNGWYLRTYTESARRL